MKTLLWMLLSLFLVGAGAAEAAFIDDDAPSRFQENASVNGVRGVANEILLANYHPSLPNICAIEQSEQVLAVAQSADGAWLRIYAGGAGCEGPVWVAEDAAIAWDNVSAVQNLPTIPTPEAIRPLDELADYEALCATAAAGNISNSARGVDDVQRLYVPGGWSWLPPGWVATEGSGADAIVCLSKSVESLGICANVSARVERFRETTRVQVLSYPDGALITQNSFDGPFPQDCPSAASQDASIFGAPVERETWTAWLISRLRGVDRELLRSNTASFRLNARAESNTQSEILSILDQGTPVNLIARNEAGTWGVVLLPDMSQAWLFMDYVNVAAQTDFAGLPIVSGAATAVEIVPE